MIEKVKKTLLQATEAIRDQANSLGGSAMERTYKVFDQWAEILPVLQEVGLEMQSFGISLTLNPSMEVAMTGQTDDFLPERLQQLMEEHKSSTILTSVFRTMKTTHDIHEKAGGKKMDQLHLKLLVTVPPEIKVVYGEPTLL
ncbi:MAG: hypothetical protein AAFV95_26565 [Bacteroidota bacterium]